MQGIYLSLGTNLGDRETNLRQAIELLELHGLVIKATSSIYETAAWGKEDQPDFLNQILEVETDISPENLLELINTIEKEMGRVRFERWGERLIDIDLLYYHNEIRSKPELQIPHPEIANRRFVLAPMAEIAGDEEHPILRSNQNELLTNCLDPLEVRVLVTGEV